MPDAQRETGRLTAVYHPHGTFSDGTPRLRRANYDLLEWSSVAGRKMETFVIPLGFERITHSDLNDFDVGKDSGDATDIGQEFGFYRTRIVVIEPHEADGADSWIGLQFFGPI